MLYEVDPNFTTILRPSAKAFERWPPEGTDLSRPLDGIFVYNLSESETAYVQIDARASGADQDLRLPPTEWRGFLFRVTKYVSVWSRSLIEVHVVGYRRLPGVAIAEVRGVLEPER